MSGWILEGMLHMLEFNSVYAMFTHCSERSFPCFSHHGSGYWDHTMWHPVSGWGTTSISLGIVLMDYDGLWWTIVWGHSVSYWGYQDLSGRRGRSSVRIKRLATSSMKSLFRAPCTKYRTSIHERLPGYPAARFQWATLGYRRMSVWTCSTGQLSKKGRFPLGGLSHSILIMDLCGWFMPWFLLVDSSSLAMDRVGWIQLCKPSGNWTQPRKTTRLYPFPSIYRSITPPKKNWRIFP